VSAAHAFDLAQRRIDQEFPAFAAGLPQARQEALDAFRSALGRDYLRTASPRILERLFAYAWEQGHASGGHEVENVFADVADIVNDAVDYTREEGLQ
jgi:hypothetical protein